MDPRRERAIVAHHDIVPDRTVEVDLDMPTQYDVSRQDVAGAYHSASANVDPLGAFDPWVDNGSKPKTDRRGFLHEMLTGPGMAYATNNLCLRKPLMRFIESNHWYAIQLGAMERRVIINETHEVKAFSSLLAGLDEPCNLSSKASSSIDSYLLC
jgi:hypothetical protein